MSRDTNVAALDVHACLRMPIIMDMLQAGVGERILDLGSGTGLFTQALLRRNASPVCVDICRENLLYIRSQEPDLWLINGDAERLPVAKETFDKALCAESLEHMKHDATVIAEVARVLKPHGVLVVTVPCSDYRFPTLVNILRVKTVHDYDGPEKHYRKGYDLNGLSELLRQAGFTVSQHAYFGHFFSQLILDIITLGHIAVRKIFMKQETWNWADIQKLDDSKTFRLYRFVFPMLLFFCKLDRLFFRATSRGSGLAIRAIKQDV